MTADSGCKLSIDTCQHDVYIYFSFYIHKGSESMKIILKALGDDLTVLLLQVLIFIFCVRII